MTETHDIVIKSDRRGRLRFTREQRAAMLEAYDTSGLSGPKFAQLHGINYQTFAGWVQRRKRPAPPATARAGEGVLSFIEATVDCRTQRQERGLEILLPGEVRLLIGDLSQVDLAAALIRHLQFAPSC